MTTSLESEPTPAVAGRETTDLYRGFCLLLVMLSVAAGFFAVVGSHYSTRVFAWETAAPVNLLLLAAFFLGAVPLMAAGAVETLWERNRIAVIPGAVMVIALTVPTLRNLGDTYVGGGEILAFAMSVVWVLALVGTSLMALVGIRGQYAEPALALPRLQPMPGWAVPLIALQGSAWFGLGAAFLVRPEVAEQWIPWQVSALDAGALGAVCLTLGTALLQALTENDLQRVRPGLHTLVAVGALGLVALAVGAGDVQWASWTGPISAALVAGLLATGVIGTALARSRATGVAPPV